MGTGPTRDVLLVDDEPIVREVVARYLERDGFAVHEAADGDAAMTWLDTHDPELVVLDLMLPGVDGLAILRRLRRDGDVPVIVLSAKVDEVDRILGLELGADDYVTKPFSPRELATRARTVLRRCQAEDTRRTPADEVLAFGDLRVDGAAREVTVAGRAIDLRPKEFDLLVALAGSPRRVFTRRQLLELVWDSAPEYQDPATVTVHIGRLRQKLEPTPEAPRWILTARGVGYRFEP